MTAWELAVDLDVCERVVLEFPEDFPFELPHFFLTGPSRYGELSHVARNGQFCYIDNSGITYEIDRIADAVEEAVDRSLAALRDPRVLRDEDEFRKELFFYLPTKGRFYALLPDLSATRRIYFATLKKRTEYGVGFVAADTEPECLRWISNAGLGEVETVEEATFIPNAFPGRPPFPANVGEYLASLRTQDPTAAREFLRQVRRHPTFVTTVDSSLGPSLVAWKLGPSRFADPKRSPKMRGFRPGHYPVERELFTERSRETIAMYQGERIDLGRLAERTDPGFGHGLAKKVVLVGAGAIGSHVIELICGAAMCGSVAIFDYDILKPENVLRHTGGWSLVGYRKSVVVGIGLAGKHPHLSISYFGDAISGQENFLAEASAADVIILATGSEESDRFLATSAHRVGKSGLVTAQLWVESEAQKGHVLRHVKGIGACPGCGHVARARLDPGSLKQEPGCGGAYANYGGSRLQRFLAIAADYCVNASESLRLTWHARPAGAMSTDLLEIVPLTDGGCAMCAEAE